MKVDNLTILVLLLFVSNTLSNVLKTRQTCTDPEKYKMWRAWTYCSVGRDCGMGDPCALRSPNQCGSNSRCKIKCFTHGECSDDSHRGYYCRNGYCSK